MTKDIVFLNSEQLCIFEGSNHQLISSLRGRRLKGKGKGVFGKGVFRRERNARGARGRREGNAC